MSKVYVRTPSLQIHCIYANISKSNHIWSQAFQVRDTCAQSLLLVWSKCSSPLKIYVAALLPNVITSAGGPLKAGRVRGDGEGETLVTE